jgi:tRNA U55 pseudouridine synthase TruB
MLKEAGLSDSRSIQTVRRWLNEGKVKYDGTGSRNTEAISVFDNAASALVKEKTDQDKDEIIRYLKLKIKEKDVYIEGVEELHKTATKIVSHQRDMLTNEIIHLKNEKRKLQSETMDLLKENIQLREELIKLKEEGFTGKNSANDKHNNTVQYDLLQKFGLSKMASSNEVLSAYKELLKLTHPDHGGNTKLFHYIKTDYDNFRNSIK